MKLLTAASALIALFSMAALPLAAQTSSDTPFEMPGVFRISLPPGWQQNKVIDDRDALAVFSNNELTLEVIRDLSKDPSDTYSDTTTQRRLRPEADQYTGKYAPPEVRADPGSFQAEITNRYDEYTMIGGLPMQWMQYQWHYTHPQKEGETPKTDQPQVSDSIVWTIFTLSPGEYWSLEIHGDEKANWSSDVKRMVQSFQLLDPTLSYVKAAIPKEAYDRVTPNLPDDKCEFVGTSTGMGAVIPCSWTVTDRGEYAPPADSTSVGLIAQEVLKLPSGYAVAIFSHYTGNKSADDFVKFAKSDLASTYKQVKAEGTDQSKTEAMTYKPGDLRQVTADGFPAALIPGTATAKKVQVADSVQMVVVTKGNDHFTLVVASSNYCTDHVDECAVDQIIGSARLFALRPKIEAGPSIYDDINGVAHWPVDYALAATGDMQHFGNTPTKEQLDRGREDARLFNDSNSHYNLAMLLYRNNDSDGAFTELKAASALNLRNEWVNREIAVAYASRNDPTHATAAYERVLHYEADAVDDTVTHGQLATLYARSGAMVIALNDSRLAGDQAPQGIMSDADLATVGKQVDDLTTQLDKANKDCETNPTPQNTLLDAQLGLQIGDFMGADNMCSDLLQSDSRNTGALECLLQTSNARGEQSPMVDYAQQWLALSPDNPEAYYWLARGYLWDPVDYKKAAQNYEAVARHATAQTSPAMLQEAQAWWPHCYEQAGMWQDAANAYESDARLFPTNAQILNGTAWFFATTTSALHNPKKALDYANRAVAAGPNDPNIIDTLAEAYYTNGRMDDAIATEEKALALAPNRDDLQKQLEKFKAAKTQHKK